MTMNVTNPQKPDDDEPRRREGTVVGKSVKIAEAVEIEMMLN